MIPELQNDNYLDAKIERVSARQTETFEVAVGSETAFMLSVKACCEAYRAEVVARAAVPGLSH